MISVPNKEEVILFLLSVENFIADADHVFHTAAAEESGAVFPVTRQIGSDDNFLCFIDISQSIVRNIHDRSCAFLRKINHL